MKIKISDYVKSLFYINNNVDIIVPIEDFIEVIMYCKYNDDTYTEIMSYLKDIQIEHLKKENK